jgi:DNA-binding NtrC family response regulator
MPNLRALGRRLSCLVAGLFDGAPVPTMLEESGFEVVHSAEPQDALKALDTDLWQVVLLSESVGAPAMQAVIERSTHSHPPPPVVVVGSANGSDLGELALRMGAADFVVPPFDRDVLDTRLRRLLDDRLPGDMLSIPATATLSDVERILISEHLRRARTKADAARSLGMGLRTLYTKIDKYQLADISRRNSRTRTGRG